MRGLAYTIILALIAIAPAQRTRKRITLDKPIHTVEGPVLEAAWT